MAADTSMRKSKTFVSRMFLLSDRRPEADWAGSDVLRIPAYRGSDSRSLFMGAELPVQSPEVMVDMVAALCAVYNDGRRAATPHRTLKELS